MIGVKQKISLPKNNKLPTARSRGISVTQNNQIRKQLDHIIKQDYHEIKIKNKNILSCGVCSHNPLIMDYIRNIYEDYQIQDPLKNEKMVIINQFPKQKEQNKFSRSIYQTPNKNLEETIINTTLTYGEGESSQKNKNLKNSQRQIIGYSASKNYFTVTPKNRQSRVTIGFPLSQNRKIKQSFRYCIACQKPIIQANIEIHQQQCQEFKKIYEMQLQNILIYIQKKIDQIKQKISNKSQKIISNDADKFHKEVNSIISKSQFTYLDQRSQIEFLRHYNQAMEIGLKWGDASEQINKLRWFIRIRQQIKKQFVF